MKLDFPVVIIDEDFHANNASGEGIRMISKAIEQLGVSVLAATSRKDVMNFVQHQKHAAAFIFSIDDEDFEKSGPDQSGGILNELQHSVTTIRKKNSDVPIYLCGETKTSRHIPNSILRELHGFLHLDEDTPEFIGKHIVRETADYLDSIVPPFFKSLLEYAQKGSYSWHCPGHSGGVAFLKSPVGKVFHQFYGENLLRSDVCNAVDELGQLLDHTGPIEASEKNAARIFNADHLFFVTNGTSTSNKIVWHSCVGPDDIVLVDRNCHKSNLHAIIMTGAIPIYMTPTRNHFGIIGPIPKEEFSMETLQKKIDAHPLIKDKTKKPRIMTLTQSTYDGISYNVETIKGLLDGKVEVLHFDEAWVPHAGFHDLYKNMHAIGKDRPKTKESIVFSTQSTHKMLAGLSQASQILVSDSENKKLNKHLFNEAYLMHTSTSPQYSIIASCDVSAAMMDGPGGQALVEESIVESIDFRRAMRKTEAEWGDDWWFKVWGPDKLAEEGIGTQEDWTLKSNEDWHGFGNVADGFNILDPVRTTILTPGLKMTGEFDVTGIPAAIVTKYLAEHGVIVEKCGLYSFFIMFTIGITKGRWNTLLAMLEQFKTDYDNNALMSKILPKFSNRNPKYKDLGLKDFCQKIHTSYKKENIAKLTTEMYLSEFKVTTTPANAFRMMSHGKIKRVEIDKLLGETTAVLLTPYPPGIPLLVPGEKINELIVQYLQFAREFNEEFPGFETDVHGLVIEIENGVKKYYVDCLQE